MIKKSEVGERIRGLKGKKTVRSGEKRERGRERRRERGTDRDILLVPLYFQPSVKMNFTS